MLLEKPGPPSALGAGSEPGQGQGPGSTVPPTVPGARFASGTGHNADVPYDPPRPSCGT
jgi:hypothetical protein